MKILDTYGGVMYDNLVQAQSETCIPKHLIEYSIRHKEPIHVYSRWYKFIYLYHTKTSN